MRCICLYLVLLLLLSNLHGQSVSIYNGANNTSSNPLPASTPAVVDPAVTPTDEQQYTVVKGDTLWKISHKFKVDIKSIVDRNQLPNDRLSIGTVLQIPKPKPLLSKKDKIALKESGKALVSDTPTIPALPPTPPAPVLTLGEKLNIEIKQLASCKVGYDKNWTPPGETEAWSMDCSNTSRWLFKKVGNLNLPRTASEQYDLLQHQERAWLAPKAGNKPDVTFLDEHLKVGDLLFWENTYKPERQPPVTHVMVYLGKDDQGRRLMAGSQTSKGFFNPAGNGPDVYVFDPEAPCGGFNSGFLGLFHTTGHFIGYGRPL